MLTKIIPDIDDKDERLVKDITLAEEVDSSRSSIWRWAKQGLIPPPVKIGGCSRFRLYATKRMLQENQAQNAA